MLRTSYSHIIGRIITREVSDSTYGTWYLGRNLAHHWLSIYFSLFGVVSCTCLPCLINVKELYWVKSHVLRRTNIKTTQFMPDMNWSQNIGSALILCLSTISVILQPLLSKFSFLINLVSRNGSFFPHLICVSWQIFLLFSWVPHGHRHYRHCFLFPLLVIYKSSPAFSQCFSRGDGMGFTNWPLVWTIMLPVCDNATQFYVLIFFSFGSH